MDGTRLSIRAGQLVFIRDLLIPTETEGLSSKDFLVRRIVARKDEPAVFDVTNLKVEIKLGKVLSLRDFYLGPRFGVELFTPRSLSLLPEEGSKRLLQFALAADFQDIRGVRHDAYFADPITLIHREISQHG